jgi:hypothetical protein
LIGCAYAITFAIDGLVTSTRKACGTDYQASLVIPRRRRNAARDQGEGHVAT